MKKRLAILGSTGSIGASALAVVRAQAERLEVVGLAAGENVARFAEQVEMLRPRAVALASRGALTALGERVGGLDRFDVAGAGRDGLAAVATHPAVDLVLCATSGTAALDAVVAAIRQGKTIALANKEILVMAGALVVDEARRHGVAILPVDSEHNAIHQCLHGRPPAEVRRLVLTASGGPFRDRAAALDAVTPDEALRHPTWTMGPKITIDSATLMNKGLEVIEAHWLFGMPPARIDVVVHPQSVVHSMVELCDGSIIAQLGATDMQLPIQYAFSFPERWPAAVPGLDLVGCGRLDFERPDPARFPCLGLAYAALGGSATLPAVMNAANEVAVAAFLDGRLGFTGIPDLIDRTMAAHEARGGAPLGDLDDARDADRWARAHAQEILGGLQSK